MFCSVLLCFLVTFVRLQPTLSAEGSRYECGAHGTFEYCINDIPGCVIGCHCHPGYYFDTNTKICEPNSKLTEDFRRRYLAQSSRARTRITPKIENIPTPTTVDPIDEKAENIAKDNDDLSDWLYNQFFKTIESQVINNTNENQLASRRSGTGDLLADGATKRKGGRKRGRNRGNLDIGDSIRKPTRRYKGRKRKSKVHGLRRKLLRITEDDSLFDSESGSHSESDSDDSSRSDSTDTSGSSSSEKSSEHTDKESKDHREHGHKKVILYNKRPRPPLPSFIILPSMDSPYYPPIGLPPPPILPMYPMVPIPPMAPLLPTLGPSTDDISNPATTANPVSDDTSATTPTSESDVTDAPSYLIRRNKVRGHKSRRKRPLPNPAEDMLLFRSRDEELGNEMAPKKSERLKILRRLRARLRQGKLPEDFNEVMNDAETGMPAVYDDDSMPQDVPPLPPKLMPRIQDEDGPKVKDVNFKYISELIHKMSPNVTMQASPAQDQRDLNNPDLIEKSRRKYDSTAANHPHTSETTNKTSDDAYFTNLGRQIASLIRNADSKVDSKTMKDKNNLQELLHPILNANNIASQAFWERSVRSPMKKPSNDYDDLNTKIRNNDDNLFNLENEVAMFARTKPPMSLQDLENILNTLKKSQARIKKASTYLSKSSDSLNVNLLPIREENLNVFYRRLNSPPEYTEHTTQEVITTTKMKQEAPSTNITYYGIHANRHMMPMLDDWTFNNLHIKPMLKSIPPVLNQQPSIDVVNNKSSEYENAFEKTQLRKPLKENDGKPYLKFLKRNPISDDTSEKSPEKARYKHQTNPSIVNYKTLNYYSEDGTNHGYMFQAAYPIKIRTFKKSFPRHLESEQPSYFHHEFHHFDYID